MKLEIVKMHLHNFQGCRDMEIEFSNRTSLIGRNGSGKTTIANAFYYVMGNCNMAMVNNPPITPIGETECITRVDIDFLLDGKPFAVAKSQRFKSQEVDGKVVSKTENTYEINSVAKSQRDFIAGLNDRGINMDDFMIHSNPAAFIADDSKKGREVMRNTLFGMAEDVTDADIAKEIGDETLVAMLDTYKLEEIRTMHKATIKKITDENGKSNEIINARISGLIESKSKQDIKVLEAQKAEYEAEVERIENEIDNLVLGKSDLMKKLTDLKVERDKMVYEANNKLMKQKAELESAMHEMKLEISDKKFKMAQAEDAYDNGENVLTNARHDLEKQRDLFKDAQDMIFDEADTVCPTCMQVLPKDKIDHLKAEFDKKKADRIKVLKASGKALNERISALESELKSTKEEIEKFKVSVADSEHKMLEIEAEMNKIPASVDMTMNEDYAKLTAQIAKLEAEIPKDSTQIVEELKSQRNVNKAMLNQILGEIGALDHNKEIDDRIEKLRQKRKDDEVIKSQAEKVLHSIEMLERRKNEKLTDSINSHFNIVSFKLFDFLKNGNYVETVEMLIDGKPISSCANGSLIQLAKIDCLTGLQNFHNQHVPVFLEDAALITSNTNERISLDSQLIRLIAADGIDNLMIERG